MVNGLLVAAAVEGGCLLLSWEGAAAASLFNNLYTNSNFAVFGGTS